jgi:ABC-type Fe3+-hydroxamate transport system substrate-binding protein
MLASPPQNTAVLALSLLLLLLALAEAAPTRAETRKQSSPIQRLWVDSFGQDSGAIATRRDIIRRLRKAEKLQIVDQAGEADCILKGTARIWSIGHISLNPRSHGPIEPILEGFLSTELVGKNGQTLYTPRPR